MNKESVIKQFAKENLVLLTSGSFDKKTLKKACKSFFYERHKNKFGLPPNREIMSALVEVLISNGVNSDEIKKQIYSLPFFRETSEDTRKYLIKMIDESAHVSALSKEALETIKAVDAYKAVEQFKGKEIEDQKKKELEELDKKIEVKKQEIVDKKQEYEAIPSILDSEHDEEPQINPEVEEVKPWWQRFYLKADPFPEKAGLGLIPEELYERVIIKTKPFQDTLSSLQRNPNYLFHTGFLLVGGYGYGKTTFIDYLIYYLINLDIIPIRIISQRTFPDSSGFSDNFYQRLKKELQDEAMKMTSFDKNNILDLAIEDQITELSSRIISAQKKGIVLFLDDYHKHERYFTQICEFLGKLQMLKDHFMYSEINVGFVISGLPSWKDELKRNPQLSGFLDNTPIEIPEATADLICEIFNQRIKAYCYESTPRLIKEDFVQKLVREQGGKTGVRDYLRNIVNELSKNNQAIVDSPVEIPEDKLYDIRQMIEFDPAIKSSFNKLLYEAKFNRYSKEQIAKCLELIVHIAMQNGISEDDKQFLDNKYYFHVLKEADLIQKQKPSKGFSLEWGLRDRFRKVISDIFNKHRLNIHDYLLKIYAYKDYWKYSISSEPEEVNELTELKRLINKPDLRIGKSILDHVNLGIRLYDSLFLSDGQIKVDQSHLDRAIKALEELSLGLFELDNANLFFSKFKIHDVNTKWTLHPFNDEPIQEAFIRIRDAQDIRTSQTFLRAVKQVKNAFPLIAGHIKTIIEDQCTSRDFALLNRPLTHSDDEINLFLEIRNLSYSNIRKDHFEYVKKLTDLIEIKLREFLFFTSFLLFGENYFEQCPKSKAFIGYAYKNLDGHPAYVTERNKFDGLTRPQFKSIINDSNNIRDHIIKHIDLNWKQEDWQTFFEEFANKNIKTAHQHIDTFSATERSSYLRYCKMAEELLAAINRLISEYIQTKVFICIASKSSTLPEDCLFRSSIKKPQIKDPNEQNKQVYIEWPKSLEAKEHILEHIIHSDTFNRVFNSIAAQLDTSPNGILIQELLDIEYITTHYDVKLTDFIHCLVYSKHVSRKLIIEPWFGSSIAITSYNRVG